MPELQEHILAKDYNVDPLRFLFPSGNKKPRIVRGFLNNGRMSELAGWVNSQVLSFTTGIPYGLPRKRESNSFKI